MQALRCWAELSTREMSSLETTAATESRTTRSGHGNSAKTRSRSEHSLAKLKNPRIHLSVELQWSIGLLHEEAIKFQSSLFLPLVVLQHPRILEAQDC